MSLCAGCGNALIHGCGPTCLVCQHTGRAESVLKAEALALDAVYAAMMPEDWQAQREVFKAQESLAQRISNSCHNRERPNLEQEAEDDRMQFLEVCQTCFGTGHYLAGRCPDCQSED